MQDHVHDSRAGRIIATNVASAVIACMTVFLRFVSRRLAHAERKTDDWLMVASLVKHYYYQENRP